MKETKCVFFLNTMYSVVKLPQLLMNYTTKTLCLKKRPNFETLELEIIRIDFDDISHKYLKD